MDSDMQDTSDEFDPRGSDAFDLQPESDEMVSHFDRQLDSRMKFCQEMVERHRRAADFWEREASVVMAFRSGDWSRPKAMEPNVARPGNSPPRAMRQY